MNNMRLHLFTLPALHNNLSLLCVSTGRGPSTENRRTVSLLSLEAVHFDARELVTLIDYIVARPSSSGYEASAQMISWVKLSGRIMSRYASHPRKGTNQNLRKVPQVEYKLQDSPVSAGAGPNGFPCYSYRHWPDCSQEMEGLSQATRAYDSGNALQQPAVHDAEFDWLLDVPPTTSLGHGPILDFDYELPLDLPWLEKHLSREFNDEPRQMNDEVPGRTPCVTPHVSIVPLQNESA
jgi:hypothetical protein